MCCVVEDAIFNVEKNYFLEDVETTTRSIIYDSYSKADATRPYDPSAIVPNLYEIMDKGYPLIFNTLEYMGKSIGFVCFSFEKYDLVDYSKTPSISNCLGMGLGGFITLRYQEFLREKVKSMYQNDALTGLYNRLAFLSKFDELKADPSLEGQELTIIMSDLNGLKFINDTLGHTAGDHAIAAVAKALKHVCPPESLCVRFGGDEMLALITEKIDNDEFVEKMQEHLKRDSEKLGFTVSASYGAYSTTLTKDLDLDKIISIADEHMYKMKRSQ